jgi:hypothetical protein
MLPGQASTTRGCKKAGRYPRTYEGLVKRNSNPCVSFKNLDGTTCQGRRFSDFFQLVDQGCQQFYGGQIVLAEIVNNTDKTGRYLWLNGKN